MVPAYPRSLLPVFLFFALLQLRSSVRSRRDLLFNELAHPSHLLYCNVALSAIDDKDTADSRIMPLVANASLALASFASVNGCLDEEKPWVYKLLSHYVPTTLVINRRSRPFRPL